MPLEVGDLVKFFLKRVVLFEIVRLSSVLALCYYVWSLPWSNWALLLMFSLFVILDLTLIQTFREACNILDNKESSND